ncbi:MAG: hypothetical protein RLZ98_709 [Pseudomonadota bacterium]|jgi:zinc transport system ATP-binding protein
MAPHTDGGKSRLIEAHGIGVCRDGRWLVRNVDITVAAGEIVTLIGPNGGGKSTTARAALGLIAIDEGNVERRPGLNVGYVPQRLTVDRTLPLTVRRLLSLTSSPALGDVDQALEWVGLSRYGDAQVHTLSGGEFQRALLARAIVRKPDLLVLDEPVQGVDFTGEVALYDLIGEIRARLGCGILLISHDLHIVMAATDTVVCLNGHVCCHGTPATVSESPEYLRLFGPRAAETLAVYQHHHDHSHADDGSLLTDVAGGTLHQHAKRPE